jgi:O-antigen/teichoic acid export membrane protein
MSLVQKAIRSSKTISIVEQAILSAANFIALLILAHDLPKEQYGIFTLAYTSFLFFKGFQRALLSIPMVVYTGNPDLLIEHGRSWRKLQAGLTGIICILSLAALGLTMLLRVEPWVQSVLGIALLISLPMFYYEFFRRWLIQEGKLAFLVLMALLFGVIYVGGIVLFTRQQQSALPAALMLAGGAWAATLIGYIKSTPPKSELNLPFASFLFDQWKFGQWSVLSHVAFAAYNNLSQFILAFFVGPSGVAVFQATRNLTQPVLTLLMAIDNVDKPRASASLMKGGVTTMVVSLRNTSQTLILFGGSYLLLIGILAPYVLHALYAGKYDGATTELLLWLPVSFLILLGQPLESGLYVLKRPDLLFKGRSWAAIAGVTTTVIFVPIFGVSGALLGLLVGRLLSAVFAFFQLKTLVKEDGIT